MVFSKPTRSEILKAIDLYLPLAYGSVPVPKAVQQRIDDIAHAAEDQLYRQKALEVDPATPSRYAIRLGNRSYPNMKLIIEPAPAGPGHLFRADTHDQHIRPQPGTPDAELFARMVSSNRQIAEDIEAAWERANLPTFKAYLRHDLAMRASSLSQSPAQKSPN